MTLGYFIKLRAGVKIHARVCMFSRYVAINLVCRFGSGVCRYGSTSMWSKVSLIRCLGRLTQLISFYLQMIKVVLCYIIINFKGKEYHKCVIVNMHISFICHVFALLVLDMTFFSL